MAKETEIAYIAGFFDGEGCISISLPRGAGFIGTVYLAQRNPHILYEIQELMEEVGIRSRLNLRVAQLEFPQVSGSEFLELILAYMRNPKQRRRAKIYMKMFAVGSKYKQRYKERMTIFEEWLDLRILELKERIVEEGEARIVS